MIQLQPISTRTDTLCPDTTLFRPSEHRELQHRVPEVVLCDSTQNKRSATNKTKQTRSHLRTKTCALVEEFSCTLFSVRLVVKSHIINKRSEEHTSELTSIMRNSYAVFCVKKQQKQHHVTENK